ncbi:MAG: Biopolymer transport protein ExbD/TolR [Gemmatimonadetes bacterium]|nr:Biopolymer transport protein ExbD/TolR [Gemmatimonadota bacterium]
MAPSARPLSNDINVTPMLDVMLVLLVIFLAAISKYGSMDVSLPEPCTGACREGAAQIVLEVLPGHAYRLNSEPLTPAQLRSRIFQVYSGRPMKVLQVAGYPGATYDDVVQAMDVAKGAGVRVIGIPPRESYLPVTR